MTDHEYTTHPVCPHCGHIHKDAWEWHFDSLEGETDGDCHACGEPFATFRHAKITYTTKPLQQKP